MKLALGTVQFGLNYGVANQCGQISKQEGFEILKFARNNGLDTLDTAIGYGDSEQRLGNIGITDWQVISKLPAIPDGCSDIEQWVFNSVIKALIRLKIDRLDGLLLHCPMQLKESNGNYLYDSLIKLKKEGLVNKIGVSIYDTTELDALFNNFQFDIIQAPFNVLDNRLIETGWMSRLTEKNIELHVRSVFLQGLLLMKSIERPKKFNRWSLTWFAYEKWLKQNKMGSLQACLKYVMSFKEVNKVIVGVDSLMQMREVIQASLGSEPSYSKEFMQSDIDLINPARWDSL